MIFLLLACTDGDNTETGKGPTDSAGNADVTVTPTAKDSVFRVSWETDEASDARVEYSTDDSYDHTAVGTSSDDGLSHEVLLAGLAYGETWNLRAVSTPTAGGEDWVSGGFEIETPAWPSGVPQLTIASGSDTTLPGFLLVSTPYSGEGISTLVTIYDHQGRAVWYSTSDDAQEIGNAWLDRDGTSVWWTSWGDFPFIHHEGLDGEVLAHFSLTSLSHDFTVLPDGSVVSLEEDPLEYEGIDVLGEKLQHYSGDGEDLGTIWSLWDEFPLKDGDIPPDPRDPYEYTHGNALRYYEEEDIYLLCTREWNSVFSIDGTSLTTNWIVGGTHSAYDMSGIDEEDQFAHIHGASLTDGGILVFNNRDQDHSGSDLWSQGMMVSMDDGTMTASVDWTYDAGKEVFAPVMGNVEDISDGRRLVAFGAAGRIVEVDGDTLVWQADEPLGTANGYVHHLETLAGATF